MEKNAKPPESGNPESVIQNPPRKPRGNNDWITRIKNLHLINCNRLQTVSLA